MALFLYFYDSGVSIYKQIYYLMSNTQAILITVMECPQLNYYNYKSNNNVMVYQYLWKMFFHIFEDSLLSGSDLESFLKIISFSKQDVLMNSNSIPTSNPLLSSSKEGIFNS